MGVCYLYKVAHNSVVSMETTGLEKLKWGGVEAIFKACYDFFFAQAEVVKCQIG